MARLRAYMDHNASAPLTRSARAAMLASLDIDANPSSVHAEGRAARKLVEDARRDVAALVKAQPANVVFTSGATEAASTLLTPRWRMGRAPVLVSQLVVCAADHPCTLNGGRFLKEQVATIGVDGSGLIRLEDLETALKSRDRGSGLALVAVHAANNETGVIQPVEEIARLVKAAGALLVLDAVQPAGRVPLDISACGADFLILSSHKIGGPKGVGAFVGVSDLLAPEPLISGGGQEKGRRAGTENLAAIAGFGAAAREAADHLAGTPRIRAARDRIEEIILEKAPDAVFFGAGTERLANTTFFAIPGVKAETAQIAFDLAGVALSAGSACSSGKVGPSHVLRAMGHGEFDGALRVSIGRETGEAELALFEQALGSVLARRSRRASAA